MKTAQRTLLLAALALAGAATAPAAIIYSGLQDITIPTTFEGVSVEIPGGVTPTPDAPGWMVNFFFGGFGIANSDLLQPVRSGTTINDPVLNLAPDTLISLSSSFAAGFGGSQTHLGPNPGQFAEGSEAYLGFAANIGGTAKYGWMRVELTANTAGGLIRDWAYESTGGAIRVAAVPEPGALALSLFGCALLLRRCRRA
jgi:hypothetical protein